MLRHHVAGACRILLEARASPDAADKPLGETPLMEAAAPADTTIIDTLLLACGLTIFLPAATSHAVFLDAPVSRSTSVPWQAVCAGCHEAVQLLLEFRADPERPALEDGCR